MPKHKIFISGATGYIGTHLIPVLLKRKHEIFALVRKGSEDKAPKDTKIILGNALDYRTFKNKFNSCDTFVQLIGVKHPAPWKKDMFNDIDLKSVKESLKALKNSKIRHYVYVSVAHPAPIMKHFVEVRQEAEKLIGGNVRNATFLRPLYVLGPGHRWPYLILPFYKIFEKIEKTGEIAKRLGFVNINQMTDALVYAIENPAKSKRVFDVEKIKKIKL